MTFILGALHTIGAECRTRSDATGVSVLRPEHGPIAVRVRLHLLAEILSGLNIGCARIVRRHFLRATLPDSSPVVRRVDETPLQLEVRVHVREGSVLPTPSRPALEACHAEPSRGNVYACALLEMAVYTGRWGGRRSGWEEHRKLV